PAFVGEVLAPAVEPPAGPPDRLDDRGQPAVPPRQQPLDDPRLAVVVAEPDRGAVAPVGTDGVAQLGQAGVGPLGTQLRGPLDRTVWRVSKSAHGQCASAIPPAADFPAVVDDRLVELGDLQDVLVGLCRETALAVFLHLSRAGSVVGRNRVYEDLLGKNLVDQ